MTVLLVLAQFAIVIFLIVYIVRAVIRVRRGVDPSLDPDWHMRAFISLPDLITQLLFAAGLALAVIGVAATSRRLGLPVPAHWFLLAGTAAAAAMGWRLRAPAVFVLGILAGYGWILTAGSQWSGDANAAGTTAGACTALFGVTLMALGRGLTAREPTRRFGYFAWLFGLIGVLVFLMWGASLEGVQMIGEMYAGSPVGSSAALTALAAVSLAAALGTLVWAKRRDGFAPYELAGTAITGGLALALMIAPPEATGVGYADIFSGVAPKLTPIGTAWAVAFNAVLLAVLLGLVGLGYLRRENWLVNLGAVLLFVFIVFKYFDWLFTFLDRSIAFIVAGLLLLGVGAAMERGRRYVINAIEEGAGDE